MFWLLLHDRNNKISVNIREMAELDNLMAILSTLGGGYSSLGDEMTQCVSIIINKPFRK